MRKLKKELWPFQIILKSGSEEIDKWCEEAIGRRFLDWYGYYYQDNTKIYAFKDEATLLVFKLRWNYNG